MPLAAACLALLNEHAGCLDAFSKKVLHRLIDTLCRHTYCATILVSEAAQREADKPKWKLGDLRQYGWEDQVKKNKMGDVGRKTFAWDHFVTVYELRNSIMKLENPTEDSIREELKRATVAWILKSEDRELRRLKFHSRRPDPYAAYKAAGIKLLRQR